MFFDMMSRLNDNSDLLTEIDEYLSLPDSDPLRNNVGAFKYLDRSQHRMRSKVS